MAIISKNPPTNTPMVDKNGAVTIPWAQWFTLISGGSAGIDPATHELVGVKHTESGLTIGHFLKATSSSTFGFQAHGLTAADVGATDPTHDHSGGDGAQIDHGGLSGLSDDDHTQYHNDSRGLTWHTALPGDHVTNGDSHDHSGGDGAQVDHGGLAGLSDDDHTQYAKLAGRTGGQTLYGGITADDQLHLRSTTHTDTGLVDVLDQEFRIRNDDDETKRVRFEVGGFTTDTLRVLTIQDADGTISLTNHAHTGGADGTQVDHGNLGGLSDDDHTQYAKKAGDTFTGDVTLDAGILKLYKYGNGVPSEIDVYHALGTKASPLAIDANEQMFKLEVRGHDGTNWSSAARATLRAIATEAFTSTAQGTKWDFVVTETGGTTTVIALTIGEGGISSPAALFGGATNYSEFEDDGTLVFHGAAKVWEDLRVQISSVRLPASSAPGYDTLTDGVQVLWFDKDADESVHFTLQMPHSWDGSAIYPHVHWVPKATSDGTPANQKVRWGLEYTWAEVGVVFPSTSTVYGSAHTPADADVVANKHYLTSLTEITPSTDQDGISSMLVCRLFRDADSLTDNYENDAGLLEFDLHYRIDTVGSRDETTK